METRIRSWAKSTSWRIIGIAILGGISYAFTRNLKETTWITSIFHTLRFVLYYFHERWWSHISWGIIHHPLDHFPMKGTLTPADNEAVYALLKERNCLSKPEYEI